jgi:hypothetical protein
MTERLNRAALEARAVARTEESFERVPMLREFHEGKWVDREFYQRWVVEVVLQIRMSNVADAYGLYKACHGDQRLAVKLARYLAEELGHEHMLIADLAKFGVTAAQIETTTVFPATSKVMGYLRLATDERGPAPVAMWDWYLEWWSDRYAQAVTDAASREFGVDHTRGQAAHIGLDESLGHDDLMFETVARAVELYGTVESAYRDLDIFVDLCTEKFAQLHASTVGARVGS